jgi:hypothetical protein
MIKITKNNKELKFSFLELLKKKEELNHFVIILQKSYKVSYIFENSVYQKTINLQLEKNKFLNLLENSTKNKIILKKIDKLKSIKNNSLVLNSEMYKKISANIYNTFSIYNSEYNVSQYTRITLEASIEELEILYKIFIFINTIKIKIDYTLKNYLLSYKKLFNDKSFKDPKKIVILMNLRVDILKALKNNYKKNDIIFNNANDVFQQYQNKAGTNRPLEYYRAEIIINRIIHILLHDVSTNNFITSKIFIEN